MNSLAPPAFFIMSIPGFKPKWYVFDKIIYSMNQHIHTCLQAHSYLTLTFKLSNVFVSTPFIVAFVATGMNTGVCNTVSFSFSVDTRALVVEQKCVGWNVSIFLRISTHHCSWYELTFYVLFLVCLLRCPSFAQLLLLLNVFLVVCSETSLTFQSS